MIKINRNSKGFTLIELLIVIAIIGILAAIAIPAYTGYTKKSKLSGVTGAMGALKNAIMAYYTERGTIVENPTSITEINSNYGITLPSQYISAANVTTASNVVTINVTLQNIASDINGGVLNLVSTNITTSPTWTFGSANTAITPLLPKGN
jgi:type IV pilus assembly protein PilA